MTLLSVSLFGQENLKRMSPLFPQLEALEVSALVLSLLPSILSRSNSLSPLEEIQVGSFAQQLSVGSSSTAAAASLQKQARKGYKQTRSA